MYEYKPSYSKKKECLASCILALLAVLLLALSRLQGILFPALIQAAAVLLLAGAVLLLSRFVLRSYVYRIEQGDNGERLLVILETVGKRTRTVCRLSTAYVTDALTLTDENRAREKKRRHGEMVWHYYAEWKASDLCAVRMQTPDESFWILLQGDKTLLTLLNNKNI